MLAGRLRGVLIAAVVLVLTAVGFLLGRTLQEQRRTSAATPPITLAPEVAQSIRQFHRVKVERGRTVWDLRAQRADLLDAGRVVVEVPEIAFFGQDGEKVQLAGARGEIVLEGPKVERIDLEGGIEVAVGRYRLRTPSASWIDETNSVVAASGVDLAGRGLQISGNSMVVKLDTRRVVVTGDVRTVLSRDPEEEETENAPADSSAPPADGALGELGKGVSLGS